jgi:hypothetical protein
MKLSTVVFVLAGALALAIVVSAPAVDDTQVASMVATKATVVAASLAVILGMRASVEESVEGMVAVTPRHEDRGSPLEPVDLSHHRGDSAIQVSVHDVYDRSKRALQERAFS